MEKDAHNLSKPKLSLFKKIIRRVDHTIEFVEKYVVTFGIITIAALMIGNVIARSVLNRSWIFTEEALEICIILVTFLGSGYAARKGRHIRMSALYDILPQQLKKIFIIIICLVTGAIMFFLSYSSILYTLKVKQVTGMMPALNLPSYLVYMWVPIGLAIAGIEYALAFYTNLTRKEVWLSIETEWGYEEESVGIIEGSEGKKHTHDFA